MDTSYATIGSTAIPVVEKHSLSYSLTALIGSISTVIVSCNFWVNLIIRTIKSMKEDSVSMTTIIGCVILITGSLSFICASVIAGFINLPESIKLNWSRNFQQPSITPDLTEVLNKILMSFYEVCRKIFDQLGTIEVAVAINTKAIYVIHARLDGIEQRISSMEHQMSSIQQQLVS